MTQPLTANHSLQEWLDFILSLHPTEIDLGLDRLRQVATRLGLLTLPDSTVITVAGTNGKGTSCALLEQILSNAGYRVGVFSSPHIELYQERVRIDGKMLPEQEHVEAFAQISAAQQDTSLTFFEYSALGALALFAKHKPDVVLLEVGLGGRLDATNLIDTDLALITTIDLDHQEYLGDSRELVAIEKAGIMRADTAAVCGDPNPPASLATEAKRIGAQLHQRCEQFQVEQEDNCWHWRGETACYSDLPVPAIPLDNAAAVLQVLDLLPMAISNDAITTGLAQVSVPGRLEFLTEQVVVDVAHNPQAARYLASWLARQPHQQIIAVCSMLADKDMANSVAPLLPYVDQWHVAPLNVPRAASKQQMEQLLPQAQSHSDIATALDMVVAEQKPDQLVILFGSFYTVAQAKQYYRR